MKQDRRRLKRELRKQWPDLEVYNAAIDGEYHAYQARRYRNRYPRGRRWKAYDVAYKMADPWGYWHGRNE